MDENLYSRQIAVYGLDAVKNLSNSSVIINGLNGTSLEIIKHLILSGISIISIIDDSNVELYDLSDMYYLKEEDIGKNKVTVASNFVKKLNKNVSTTEYNLFLDKNNSKFPVFIMNAKIKTFIKFYRQLLQSKKNKT